MRPFLSLRVFTPITLVLLVSTSRGDIFFSGRNWTTQDATHRDNPAIHTQYTVIDANSASMRGVFGTTGQDCSMVTPLAVNVGDVISYDFKLTHDQLDLIGDGPSNYFGDSATTFIDRVANAGGKYVTPRAIYQGTTPTNWTFRMFGARITPRVTLIFLSTQPPASTCVGISIPLQRLSSR